MAYLWDYDINELKKKTEQGRIFILERQINYGFFRQTQKNQACQGKKILGQAPPIYGAKTII